MNTPPMEDVSAPLAETLRYLEELELLVEHSSPMPLTHHKIVDANQFFATAQRIKSCLPHVVTAANVTESAVAAINDSLHHLDKLERLVESSPDMPLTTHKVVDEDAFFIATQRIRNCLGNVMQTTAHAENVAATPTLCSRLRADDTLLLIVDVQERLMPAIHETERVEKNCHLLAQAARQLHLPIVLTEQNPDRLGGTVNAVREAAGFPTAIPKMLFSACTERTLSAIQGSGRKTILLCGVEAHVCVLQTALDLRDAGYSVFVARDAISSRTPENAEVGWQRMLGAGVLPTSGESAVFELLKEAGTPDFKALLPFLK